MVEEMIKESLGQVTAIGFTGTQIGMSIGQCIVVRKILVGLRPQYVHHGDCEGADAEFHGMVQLIKKQLDLTCHIFVHPPVKMKKRRYCGGLGVTIMTPLPYLDRNERIVNDCDLLIAAPKGTEVKRSGTWATVRYARRTGKPLVIVFPNGEVRLELVQHVEV